MNGVTIQNEKDALRRVVHQAFKEFRKNGSVDGCMPRMTKGQIPK